MMRKITLPDEIDIKDLKNNKYQVVIEPFYPGFGVTVGNSLRRVLLSSLEGAAVTAFKIEGAQHEFDSVDGVKEDLVEIMLNLKQLRLRSFSEEPVKLNIDVKGEKVVTAADIKKNSEVEIINTGLLIATLTEKSAKLNMELTVEQGRGYVPVEQRDEQEKLEIGNVAIDASFSPVLNVGYKIDHVRVGEMTNYEKLTMEITTDGTIDAETAISLAAKIMKDHFAVFVQEAKEEKKVSTTKTKTKKTSKTSSQTKAEGKKTTKTKEKDSDK